MSAVSMGVSTKTPAELSKLELWERGRALVGYGDWTPDFPKPYPMWAGMEAHKLFLVMRKRKVTAEEFLLCCVYAQRHHKRIENAVWVLKFMPEAKAELRELERERPASELAKEIDDALAYERSLTVSAGKSASPWIARLSRARGPYRREVLDAWRQERNL